MKTVLVDFSNYDDFSGFGEIARNYCPRLAAAQPEGLHFVFILPERHRGEFGSHVDYLSREHLKAELRRYRPHIHLWHATDQQFHYRRHQRGTLQLLTVHDLNYLHEKHGLHLLRHKIEMPWLIRRSDAITVISEYVKHDVEAHIPFLDKEPQVIYNGISDVEHGPQRRPAFVGADDERFFIAIGQVRRKKNVHTLVPMMRYFPQHKLFICGANHWAYADEIRQQIAPEDKGRILLTGKIADDEKRWLYAHADALLFPSTLEGFGIPVLEAMRFGTKVFSSRYSCLPEVCSTHASYWDSYEPQAMAAVVNQGICGWSRDGEAARQAAAYSRSFNYDRYTQQYIQLYRRLLGL
ncbi:MAG: glycosyltransferase family 4 protein [Prevotella sp.]|nr:glycosyltransferase family 4 protein [Prevotella sp.]